MIDKKKCIRMPMYFKEFQCIGGICEDNCCIGWDVEIDKKTYLRYNKTTDKELSQDFRSFIYENPDSYDCNVDYAIVELGKNNRCPFLNDRQLCRIQAKLGHHFLSNVCAAYPRYANEINGVTEYSLNVSCPEAARLVLSNRDGLEFSSERCDPSSRIIINFSVDTRKHSGNAMVEYFMELRSFTISLLQNRKYPLWERILMLGHFYKELQQSMRCQNAVPVKKLIETFSQRIEREDRKAETASAPADLYLQFKAMQEITNKLNTVTEIDSEKYIAYTMEFSKGIGISEKSDLDTEVHGYRKAYQQYYEPFMKDHAYLIENYLVNYVFGGLFPAAESKDPFEAYTMLAIRYALIRYHLVGISAYRKGLTEEDCIRFIQAFSKAIEHHHTYLEGIASFLRQKKCYTMPFIEQLIKN